MCRPTFRIVIDESEKLELAAIVMAAAVCAPQNLRRK
jgi:hypothetical protein